MANRSDGISPGFEQLKKELREKTLSRFYVFYGEEDYLRTYYLEQVKKQLLDDFTADFNFHRLNAETFSLQMLSDSVEALPMMSERSLILIEDVDLFTLKEDEREKTAELLSDLPEYCCLILNYSEFKPDKRMKKLWSVIEKNAVLTEFCYQSESELRAWIARHFRHYGKMIAPENCSYLLQLCGLSMTQLNGEIDKICAYSGADTVVRADIDAVVEPTLDAVSFQLSDALARRDFDVAVERMNALLKMQTEPIMIVAAIGAQMRKLYAAKLCQKEGKGAQELSELLRCSPRVASVTIGQAKRFSERFCKEAVLLCCETDYQLKASYGNEERLVELLVLRLAEESRRD